MLGNCRDKCLYHRTRKSAPTTPLWIITPGEWGRYEPKKTINRLLDKHHRLRILGRSFPFPFEDLENAFVDVIRLEELRRAKTVMKNHRDVLGRLEVI